MSNAVEILFYCEDCESEVEVHADSETNIWHVKPCGKCIRESYLEGYKTKVHKVRRPAQADKERDPDAP